MSYTPDGEPKCNEILQQLDSHLDNSLTGNSAREVREHLAGCSACARELELRTNLRARLKSAVQGVETPAFLEARIRANLRSGNRGSFWAMTSATIAASVLLAVGVAYQGGHLRLTRSSQESYIGSVSSHVATLMRVGLGDHIHCAVFRKYPKNPPTMQQFVEKMGPKYSGIIPIVRDSVPADLKMLLAHQCKYHDRQFVHLVLKSDSQLLSVVIARKGEGEAFTAEELAPALTESGISIYDSSTPRFQMAAFESRDHMVYIISDMPKQQNSDLMRAMAPQLKSYLSKLEG
jgi:anti-sigma factor (TIGR02949 family)